MIEVKEGYVDFKQYRTYYRIVNPEGKNTPLIILHGGPGSTHNFFEIMDHVAFEDDRPIVMYDQLGCGKSSLEMGHEDLWVKETWVDELINLREKLNLKEVHILGHSWGGMLNIIYNCDYFPEGVKSIILSSTLSSSEAWRMETHRLINFMDEADQKVLLDAEETGNYISDEYKASYDRYCHKFIYGPFKVGKDPECITREKINNGEAYETAWGLSEFSPSGTLADYEYTDRLNLITSPCLLLSGLYDESTPFINTLMLNNITAPKKWVLFKNSRHMSYYEEHNEYVKELVTFMHEND